MIIISSQDRKAIKQCSCIVVGSEIGRNANAIYDVCNREDSVFLGEYATEQRAKEVLHQIRRQIETSTSSDTVFKGVRTVSQVVYQMPRE